MGSKHTNNLDAKVLERWQYDVLAGNTTLGLAAWAHNRPKRQVSTKDWRDRLTQTENFYYTLYSPHNKQRAPMVTVCLSINAATSEAARGISICHPNTVPNKALGQDKARGRAHSALFSRRDTIGVPTCNEVYHILWRSLESVPDLHDQITNGSLAGHTIMMGMYLGYLSSERQQPDLHLTQEEAKIIVSGASLRAKAKSSPAASHIIDIMCKYSIEQGWLD